MSEKTALFQSTIHPTKGKSLSAVTLAEAERRVRSIDLEPIAYKLTTPEPGVEGLPLMEVDQLVGQYRRFLVLNLMHPELSIVPTKAIDEVWHTHILDTSKYAEDCRLVFGFFLHHFPYLGLRGDDDEKKWRQQAAETRRLFKEYFGVEMSADSVAACSDTGCGGSACDGGSCDSGSCSAPGLVSRERPRPRRNVASV